MARALEDLLRQCTVRVKAGDRSGAGFFVAPGKVLTCAHVAGDDDVSVVWERDGHDPAEIRVADRTLLNDRGRAIEALTGDYPDIAMFGPGLRGPDRFQGPPLRRVGNQVAKALRRVPSVRLPGAGRLGALDAGQTCLPWPAGNRPHGLPGPGLGQGSSRA